MGGFGLAAAQAATRLVRVAPIWFAFGAILGPIALLLLRAAPPGRCLSCGTPTRGWLKVCRWCGEDVTATPAATLAIVARMSGSARVSEVSRDRPLPKPAQPSRPFQLPSDAFRPSEHADASPPKPPVAATTPSPTSASRPVAARPQLVPEQSEPYTRIGSPAAQASKHAGNGEPDAMATRVFATAVYVTGSARLESGRRYAIALHESRLQILGPTDIDPSAIILDRPVADVDANAIGGRLIVSEPRARSGIVLAFMSVAGATTDDVANMIREAARASIRP
jgi:hypothetical protein